VHRNAFEQVKAQIERAAPGLAITGGEFPITGVKRAIATAAQAAQWTAIALLVVGESHVFPAFGIAPPLWFVQAAQNKLYSAAGAFFAGNLVVTNLRRSGAFEVYYDGRRIWSKLASGRNPDVREILAALADARA